MNEMWPILGLILLSKSNDEFMNAEDLIKKHEGYREKQPNGDAIAYPDPGYGWKVPTIGWGTTKYRTGSKAGQNVKRGDRITMQQALTEMRAELNEVRKVITTKTIIPLRTQEVDALNSFAYNVGTPALLNSTLWKLLQANQPRQIVAAEFDKWTKSNGKILPGLVNRRADEKKVFLS